MASSPASFVDEVPNYEIKNGHMHISMAGTVLVMPVSVFRQGMARANRVLDEWFERQQPPVVPIKASPRAH